MHYPHLPPNYGQPVQPFSWPLTRSLILIALAVISGLIAFGAPDESWVLAVICRVVFYSSMSILVITIWTSNDEETLERVEADGDVETEVDLDGNRVYVYRDGTCIVHDRRGQLVRMCCADDEAIRPPRQLQAKDVAPVRSWLEAAQVLRENRLAKTVQVTHDKSIGFLKATGVLETGLRFEAWALDDSARLRILRADGKLIHVCTMPACDIANLTPDRGLTLIGELLWSGIDSVSKDTHRT